MEYNHIFSKYRPKTECFPDFGFIADDSYEGIYSCKKNLNVEGFFAELKIDVKRNVLEAHVFDGNSSERYALFDVASAQGNFVGIIREQVQMIIDDFCAKCCSSKNLLSDYLDFISHRFSVEAEFPWEDESSKSNGKSNDGDLKNDYAVFRCPNGKWFALVMKITYRQLLSTLPDDSRLNMGCKNSEEKIWTVNLKSDPDIIPEIIDGKSIFPAYHMNKKHWITLVLTAAGDLKKICALTERSFELVNAQKKSIRKCTS